MAPSCLRLLRCEFGFERCPGPLAFLAPLDLLQDDNPWSVLLLAPAALTTIAASVAGLRWGGPFGRAILSGIVVGLFALLIFAALFAMAVTGTPQD